MKPLNQAVGAIGGLDDPSERDCCLLQRLLSRFGLPEGSQQTTLNEEAQPSAGRVVQDAAPADADFSAVGLSQVGLDSCGVSRDRTREPENKTRCRAKRKIKTHWAEKFRARGQKIRSPTKSRTGSSEPPVLSPRRADAMELRRRRVSGTRCVMMALRAFCKARAAPAKTAAVPSRFPRRPP